MQTERQPPSKYATGESSSSFGLIEEEYADNPFKLLVACIFLNKTPGERAISQLRRFLQAYPEPQPLSESSYEDIKPFFQNLGLFRRANWLIDLAKEWLIHPPTAGVIYQKKASNGQPFESEVAHLKGIGKYASDAWRIFCKDDLYKQAGQAKKRPEWTKVRPEDKELVAYLKWRKGTEDLKICAPANCNLTLEDSIDSLESHLQRLCITDSTRKISVSKSGMVRVTFSEHATISIPCRILLKAQPLEKIGGS